MLEGVPLSQPSLESLIQRMTHELSAKAVLLLHENGQVVFHSGSVKESAYPAMAALVAAMISAGKSLGSIGQSFTKAPSRFSCDSDDMSLNIVEVQPEYWLAALYDQPLNPGLFRMKVRRYADIFYRLGVTKPLQWEVPKNGSEGGVKATLSPQGASAFPENITQEDSSLFANITDEEIDRLFDDASS